MTSETQEHVIYRIANAPLRAYPYPHLYVEHVFPADFYRLLRAHWPGGSALVSIADTGRVGKGAYTQRFVMPLAHDEIAKLPPDQRAFWNDVADWLLGRRFLTAMIDKFENHVKQRFGAELDRYRFAPDALLVRDHTRYKIGPHTDAPHRLLSLLFYCPDDDSMKHLGTSIYLPLDRNFRCDGGRHHPHRLFRNVQTMEYLPNTLFAFFKTDHSFHGVDPINDAGIQRDLLLYDIRVIAPQTAAPTETHKARFSMLRRLVGAHR